jgi:hypothetical protein
MIAVVSSTISPSPRPGHDGARTTLSPETRLEQTRGTVASLVERGARDVLVADNSPGPWLREREGLLAPARVLHFNQPPIRNKGIGELWLLLAALEYLPEDEPLLKISGRYRVGPRTGLALRDGEDIAAKVYRHGRSEEISTRCYLVRNRAVAALLWERTLDEMYAARGRIVGPRSLMRIVRNSLRPHGDLFHYSDPDSISVEAAAFRAIRQLGLKLAPVDDMDVEGVLGSAGNPVIRE